MEALVANVKDVFRDVFPEKDLRDLADETLIVDGVGLSSLDIIKLFARLENAFDIDLINNIDPEEVGRYRVEDLSRVVMQIKSSSQASDAASAPAAPAAGA